MRQSLLLFFGLIILSISACGPQTKVVKLHDRSAELSRGYAKLLIVDVSHDSKRQQAFENEIIEVLDANGVEGVGAYPTLTFGEDVTRKTITDYGAQVGADGILITRFVSIEASLAVKEGREDTLSTCRGGGLVDSFLYDHSVIREPDALGMEFDAVVVTSLYDVATGEHVWSIQSSCFNRSELSDVLREEARAIVRQLQIDDLI